MNPQTQNQIAEYYAKLPPNVQVMFSSMAWMEILRAISDANKFSQAQNETLATETTLVLLGMISLDEYKNILFKELNLSKDIFEKVEQEIEEKVIKPVRVELIQTHEKNKTDLMESKYGSKLDERFAKLPPSIREALESVDYQNAIVDIGKNEKLTTTQLGILEEEVTKIMLGTEHREAFRSNLITKLGLSEEKVSSIITAANGHIFAPIRDFFREESLGEAKDSSIKYPVLSIKQNTPDSVSSENKTQEIEQRDMDVLSKAGVEISTDGDKNIKYPVLSITQEIPETATLPGRDEMLDSIENPTRSSIKYPVLSITQDAQIPMEGVKQENTIPVTPVPNPTVKSQPQPPTPGIPSFLANKLEAATLTTTTTTDHSLPGINTAAAAVPTKIIDPYLEPIE